MMAASQRSKQSRQSFVVETYFSLFMTARCLNLYENRISELIVVKADS